MCVYFYLLRFALVTALRVSSQSEPSVSGTLQSRAFLPPTLLSYPAQTAAVAAAAATPITLRSFSSVTLPSHETTKDPQAHGLAALVLGTSPLLARETQPDI